MDTPDASSPGRDLIRVSEDGLWCPAGGFHIDPWGPVDRALITHAHSDHARWGSRHYLAAASGQAMLRARLGDISLEAIPWAERRRIGDVTVSLHPAGHVLGSAQIRVEHRGEVWVVTGDYKVHGDPVSEPFELVRCDVLISECTFGLPVYRWPDPAGVRGEIDAWWARNQEEDRTSVLYAYSLGKAQSVIAGLDPGRGPILTHGAVERMNRAHREAGVALPPTRHADAESARETRGRAIVVAPFSAGGSSWIRKFGPVSDAFASGWMRVRGQRRRRSADRGFVLSDHADWTGILDVVRDSGAERIGMTHGKTVPMVRYLREHGWDAWSLPTRYEGEAEGEEAEGEEDGGDGRPVGSEGGPTGTGDDGEATPAEPAP